LRFLLTLLLSITCLSCFAASSTEEVDSLKHAQPNVNDADTANINRLNKLAAAYYKINPDSTYYYAQKSIGLSTKIKYRTGIADGLLQTGNVNYFKGNFAQAGQNFNRAISIYQSLHNNRGVATCYVSYGRMYTLLAEYKTALAYLNLAFAIDKKTGDEKALTDCYKNIGIVYFSEGQLSKSLDYYYNGLFIALKNHYDFLAGEIYNDIGYALQIMEVYPNALEYYKKALHVFERTNNIQDIGTINENIGEILLAQQQYPAAVGYLTKALKIAIKQDDKDGLSSLYTDLGLCYAYENQEKKAIKYVNTGLAISAQFKNVYNQAYACIGLSTIYNLQKDYNNAYKYAMQGQAYAIKLGNLSVRASAALQLNKTLAGLGKYQEAYQLLNQYIDLKNQLKNDESIQKLTSYTYELNFAAKLRQQTQHQQEVNLVYRQKIRSQRLINTIFSIIILGMIVTLIVYYRQKRKQQVINTMLEEKNHEVLEQKTSLDEQAQKLNSLNTLKDRLISVLAHDLRAPLSTLRGLFSLLQDSSITHQQLIELIPSVLKKLEYTSDFLDTLLFWINSQMENFESAVKSFSVNELVAYEIDGYKDQAQAKGITLQDNIPDTLTACADPNSIRIVVRNLITNAIKFSKSGDTVCVSAALQDDNTIIIKIKDTGIGIPAQQLKRLFKSKVDSTTGTDNEPGTGMGLLFCKDLVEKCNGKIWVTSREGEGTEFLFTIPAN